MEGRPLELHRLPRQPVDHLAILALAKERTLVRQLLTSDVRADGRPGDPAQRHRGATPGRHGHPRRAPDPLGCRTISTRMPSPKAPPRPPNFFRVGEFLAVIEVTITSVA